MSAQPTDIGFESEHLALPLSVKTGRMVLRRVRLDDAPRIAALLNNFAVAGNLAPVPLPFTVDHARAWLPARARSTDPNNFDFALTTAEDGLIGSVGFHANAHGNVQVGYWLGEPYWGQGLMTEALRAAVGWFFAHSDAEILQAGVFHFNMASLAIQHKLGFVESGRSMVECLARGENIEHIDTELSRDDFEEGAR